MWTKRNIIHSVHIHSSSLRPCIALPCSSTDMTGLFVWRVSLHLWKRSLLLPFSVSYFWIIAWTCNLLFRYVFTPFLMLENKYRHVVQLIIGWTAWWRSWQQLWQGMLATCRCTNSCIPDCIVLNPCAAMHKNHQKQSKICIRKGSNK